MTEILLLEICTNIAINFHGTWCLLYLLLSCSLYFVFLHFCIFFILVTYFVAVAFPTAFYEMSYSLSCLELCKPLSWAAFVSLE